jgi:hypothetical protein
VLIGGVCDPRYSIIPATTNANTTMASNPSQKPLSRRLGAGCLTCAEEAPPSGAALELKPETADDGNCTHAAGTLAAGAVGQ